MDALPIVSLISLLVGLILAFIGAIQLKMFGAQIYVADLVGIGMVRAMGAIMTGIIMAGRTGASFAARIGTMQVNEEIDALQTTGVSPTDFLVLPRILALSIMMPLLTIYADLMGILGGFIVGVFGLDLSVASITRRRSRRSASPMSGSGSFQASFTASWWPGWLHAGDAMRPQRLGGGRRHHLRSCSPASSASSWQRPS